MIHTVETLRGSRTFFLFDSLTAFFAFISEIFALSLGVVFFDALLTESFTLRTFGRKNRRAISPVGAVSLAFPLLEAKLFACLGVLFAATFHEAALMILAMRAVV